jgi:hypothetical protein
MLHWSTRKSTDIVIYVDELVPGNPMRHDKGSAVQCIYWTLGGFPSWFRAQTHCWFYLGIIQTKWVLDMESSVAYLMRFVVSAFFPEKGASFEHGLVYKNATGSLTFPVRASHISAFVEDLKGFAEHWSWKGSSGTLLCGLCTNIVAEHGKKKLDLSEGTHFLFKKAKRNQCQLHTAESQYACMEKLAGSTLLGRSFEQLETQGSHVILLMPEATARRQGSA